MTPTAEQLAIIEAAKSSKDNLIISALAGAAKTSTLVLIAKALGTTPILCLAFNKRIATEMQDRLPGNCTSKTLNSLGHGSWGAYLGKRLTLDSGKVYRILKDLVEQLDPKQKSEAYENFSEIMKMIETGKTSGWLPEGSYHMAHPLLDDNEVQDEFDEIPTNLEWDLVRAASALSLKEALAGTIDFNDQILLPTVYDGCTFPSMPLTMIDEAQDLSALNHATLKKIVRKNRLIAVGDECQAIYGFRGAHENSMHELQRTFHMSPLILSISFRCPISVVEVAKFRAPHMRYPEWAVEGEVRSKKEWDAEGLPASAAIICRNNAPLFGAAIKLLKNGRYPELLGNDIGKGLMKILNKLGKPAMLRDEVLTEIDRWEETKLKKARDPGKVHDQADCLRIFARQGRTLGDAVSYAQHIFNSAGPIKLLTGHKSKGLEFDDVYFLDQDLVGDKGQERNLRYVIVTRAKKSLTYITTEGFHDEAEQANVA